MSGEIKYIGKSPTYTFLFDGRSVRFNSNAGYQVVPMQNCRELIQNSDFVPSKKTFDQLKQVYFEGSTDVSKLMKEKDVFIIGSGPSLRGFDFSKLKDKFTIALNHSIYYLDSKAVLFIDRKFLKDEDRKAVYYLGKYKGIIFSAFRSKYYMEDIKGNNVCNFSLNRNGVQQEYHDGLYCGKSSGMAAINLALTLGARKIILLGYDYNENDKAKHFYNEPGQDKFKNEISYTTGKCLSLSKMYDIFAKYKNIFNCNPNSKVKSFQFESLEKFL